LILDRRHGDVREAVVFVDEPPNGATLVPSTAESLFAEMEPYSVKVGDADYSRDSLYSRKPDE
jgi:hypothetical protein